MTPLYLHLIRLQILNSLAYRFEYFSSIGTNIFFLFGSVYLWKSAYKGIGSVLDVNQEQMITYAIVSVLMTALFSISVSQTLFTKIRQGDIAIDLIRPVNLIYTWFAEDVGQSVSSVTKFCFPVLLTSVLFVKVPLPADYVAGLFFIPGCVFSFIILWQISALIGLSLFWVTEFGNITQIKDIVILILSGKLIPLWLFPGIVQDISSYLPFQYTFQAPLEIYIGRVSPAQAVHIFGIQWLWIGLFSLLICVVWRRAQKRVFVQGG